jgi:hypothetical protein
MLEASASSTLFPCENLLTFSMKYFLPVRGFKVDLGSFVSKGAYSAEMVKHMYLSRKKPRMLESESSCT